MNEKHVTRFWEEAKEWELRDLMVCAKDESIRKKAESLYKWDEAKEFELRYLKKFAKDEEVRKKAEYYLTDDEKYNKEDVLNCLKGK